MINQFKDFTWYSYDSVASEWKPLDKTRQYKVEIESRRKAEIINEIISFSFKDLGGGQYRCREGMTGKERIVESASNVEEMARDIVDGFDYSYLDDELSDAFSPTEIVVFKGKLRQAERELATRKAREAWEDRDLY